LWLTGAPNKVCYISLCARTRSEMQSFW